jgi:hypothetical protein
MIAIAPPSSPSSTAAPIYGFAGAQMGEAIDAWRAAKPTRAALVCPALPHRPDTQVCRGADVALGGGFFARQVDYTFVGGRLARIAFRSSIDAFDYVTAELKERFKAPNKIVRDTIKDNWNTRYHVAMQWKNGRSTITLSDPLPNTTQLEVRVTLDAAAAHIDANGKT